jgi:hypothetical protein
MFPYYYINTAEFKKKSYCGPLPKHDGLKTGAVNIFSTLYYWLSNGNSFTRFPVGPHPMDRSGQHKWEVSPRYVWLNLIPIIWGGRGTVEFRCHVPTVMSQKVINWLYITTAILNYARHNMAYLTTTPFDDISKITLAEIVKYSYPTNISNILTSYINERKNYYSSRRDIIGEGEITNEEIGKPTFTLTPFV